MKVITDSIKKCDITKEKTEIEVYCLGGKKAKCSPLIDNKKKVA